MSESLVAHENALDFTPRTSKGIDVDTMLKSKTSLIESTTRLSVSRKQNVCHGRVPKLGKMVPEQWWKTVFSDALYLKINGDVVEDSEITREDIRVIQAAVPNLKQIFIKNSEISAPIGKVLDLCCGQGRHSLRLANDYPGLKIHGLDQSSFLISLAQERAESQGKADQTFFTVGDCRQIPYPDQSFNLVMILGNSFGYFSSDDQDRAVLAEVIRVLQPDGRIVIDLTDGDYMRDNYVERSWEWIDDGNFVCRERQLSDDRARLYSREIVSSTERGVIRDHFYQERLYSRTDLVDLLSDAGFIVSDSGTESLDTSSKRNEALGLTASRMIISGTKSVAEVTKVSKCNSKMPATTVILGDPSLGCINKLNGEWNEEDIEGGRILVRALEKFGMTNIKTLKSHNKMLPYLLENKPSFVFNLCDEGWKNDPLKELHIPALLEMLDIPYSGAGPNCLAFCYDKGLVNRSADVIGIATPQEIAFLDIENDYEVKFDALKTKVANMGYPAFIKPIQGDNSLGITTRSIVQNAQELEKYISELRESDIADILVQEYLTGDEFGVGMIGNIETGFRFLPTLRVNFDAIVSKNLPPILGFESKWDPNSPYWTDIKYERANLNPKDEKKLQQSCIDLWKRFECRDYARFDFRSDSAGVIKLLEVNPNPGWVWDGKFAHMAKLDGLEYDEMMEIILKTSWTRLGLKFE